MPVYEQVLMSCDDRERGTVALYPGMTDTAMSVPFQTEAMRAERACLPRGVYCGTIDGCGGSNGGGA